MVPAALALTAYSAYKATHMPTPGAPAIPGQAPTMAGAGTGLDAAAQQQQAQMSRGFTSTMLTGGQGLSSMGSTSKTLLGQ